MSSACDFHFWYVPYGPRANGAFCRELLFATVLLDGVLWSDPAVSHSTLARLAALLLLLGAK